MGGRGRSARSAGARRRGERRGRGGRAAGPHPRPDDESSSARCVPARRPGPTAPRGRHPAPARSREGVTHGHGDRAGDPGPHARPPARLARGPAPPELHPVRHVRRHLPLRRRDAQHPASPHRDAAGGVHRGGHRERRPAHLRHLLRLLGQVPAGAAPDGRPPPRGQGAGAAPAPAAAGRAPGRPLQHDALRQPDGGVTAQAGGLGRERRRAGPDAARPRPARRRAVDRRVLRVVLRARPGQRPGDGSGPGRPRGRLRHPRAPRRSAPGSAPGSPGRRACSTACGSRTWPSSGSTSSARC